MRPHNVRRAAVTPSTPGLQPSVLYLMRTTCRRCREWVTVAHLYEKTQRCPACGAVLIETVACL